MREFWNDHIKTFSPYTPGEQLNDKRYTKLNTNENPYPPSRSALRAIRKSASAALRLYPDPGCGELRDCLAAHFRVSKERIFVGNGSDEVLAFAFGAFFNPEPPILFPDVTYSFYPVFASFFRLSYQTIEVRDDFTINVKPYFRENGGIVLPNPNAPTSVSLSLGDIRALAEYNLSIGKVVVVDEAYVDFGGESAIGLVGEFPNLLVVQTLSKSRSLAGLRIGFAFGQEPLIEGLNRVKDSLNSYTVDRSAYAGAIAAIEDEKHFQRTRSRIMSTRTWVRDELMSIGFTVLDSQANFLFIAHERKRAGELYRELKDRGILVRYFDKPRIDNFIRVSIGTDGQMRAFVDAVSAILATSS